jgi:hypothetical protein
MMKNKNRTLLLLPLLILFTLSCTCGAPGLKNFLPKNENNETQTNEFATVSPTIEAPIEQNTVEAQADSESQTSNGFEIQNTSSFESGDWQYIVGEIVNHQEITVDYVDIGLIFYDTNQQVINTESLSPLLSPILPGDTSPFVISSDSWNEYDHFEFVVNDWSESTEQELPNLEIINQSSYSDDYSLTIIGEIVNHESQPVQYAYVAGSLFDSTGKLMNTTTAYSLLNVIEPDGKAPFKVQFYDNWKDYNDYSLQVTGSTTEAVEKSVTLVDYKAEKDDNTCTFTGTVKNISAEESSFVSIVVSMYDANDILVDADWIFSDADSIAAGATDTFSLTIYDCLEYDHETVAVE